MLVLFVMSSFARWIGTLRDQKHPQLTDLSTNSFSGESQLNDPSVDRLASSNVQLAIPCSKGSEQASNKLEDVSTVPCGSHELDHLSVANSTPVQPRYWRLELSKSCRAMAQVLGLNRLQNYLQGTSNELLPDAPVWILGVEHTPVEPTTTADNIQLHPHEEAMEDFKSRLWFTYRCGFDPIGTTSLTSDVGWGCTLRSGQMLIAEGLMRHTLGRGWRRHSAAAVHGGGTPPEIMHLLRLLHDTADASAPFSVHNLCAAQGVPGVQPGEWLGPWVLCHALRAAVMSSRPFGIALHVLAEPGGGAPVLYQATLLEMYFPSSAAAQTGGLVSEPPAAAPDAKSSAHPTQTANAGSNGVDATDAVKADPGSDEATSALILLLPLTLGIGKVNPRYIPQLQTVLRWPQSIGIIGGRPGSSLAFIGCQEDNIVFLDPHETQQVVAAAEVGQSATYHCDTVRTMPVANIDPSLAIGFYCRSPEALRELCSQLRELELRSGGAPLVGIVEGPAPPPSSWRHVSSFDGSDEDNGGAAADPDHGSEWEML